MEEVRRQSVGGGPWEWAQSIRKTRMPCQEGRTEAELGGVGGSWRGGELEVVRGTEQRPRRF